MYYGVITIVIHVFDLKKKNLNPLCHLGGSFLINTATFPPHVTSENTGVCHNVMMPFDNLHSVAEGSNC